MWVRLGLVLGVVGCSAPDSTEIPLGDAGLRPIDVRDIPAPTERDAGPQDVAMEDAGPPTECDAVANCAGRTCGDDGCGGFCGPGCSDDQSCNEVGTCEAATSPWSGATAQARFLDAALLSSATYSKYCIYREGGDLPYVIHREQNIDRDADVTVDLDWIAAPAGIPLRVQRIVADQDTPAASCSPDLATLSLEALEADHRYTVAILDYDEDRVECGAIENDDNCTFFPPSERDTGDAPCATRGIYAVEEYDRTGTSFINLSWNASELYLPTSENSHTPLHNVATVGREGFDRALRNSGPISICSYAYCQEDVDILDFYDEQYVECFQRPDDDLLIVDFASLPEGDNTVYILGQVGYVHYHDVLADHYATVAVVPNSSP